MSSVGTWTGIFHLWKHFLMLQVYTHNLNFHLRNLFWVGNLRGSSKRELSSNSVQYKKKQPQCFIMTLNYFSDFLMLMLLKELLLPSFCSSNKGDQNYCCGFKLIFLEVSSLQFLIFLYISIHFLYGCWHNIFTSVCITQLIVRFALWHWPQFFCSHAKLPFEYPSMKEIILPI